MRARASERASSCAHRLAIRENDAARTTGRAGAARCRSYAQSVCPRNLFVHLCPPRSCGTRETDPGSGLSRMVTQSRRNENSMLRPRRNWHKSYPLNEFSTEKIGFQYNILLIFLMKVNLCFLLIELVKLGLIKRLIKKVLK